MSFDAVVIGTSAGGLQALLILLGALPPGYPIPVIVVQHRSKEDRTLLEEVLSQKCQISIRQAEEKEKITKGAVYFAPPDYHLLIEKDKTFSLSSDERINYSRPSIDVLFETAAFAYHKKLLAVVLTGANHDGASGIKRVRKNGGTTIAQDPADALYPAMPRAAIDTGCIQHVMHLDKIREYLVELGEAKNSTKHQ